MDPTTPSRAGLVGSTKFVRLVLLSWREITANRGRALLLALMMAVGLIAFLTIQGLSSA